jgi:hypothetical protein
MKIVLVLVAFVQLSLIAYLSTSKAEVTLPQTELVVKKVELVVKPEKVEERIVVAALPNVQKSLDYHIPERRVISGDGIELDKNINALGALGEVMLENPLMVRGIEKLVRNQFFDFYSGFIQEADLSPYEQAELFRLMSQAMQQNLKSMMKAIGENMGQMQGMFRDGPPPELLTGIKENNLALKDDLVASLGEEKFELFEQYHNEKSAAEDYLRLERSLTRKKTPLDDSQKESLRQTFLDDQHSPFEEDTYGQRLNNDSLYEETGQILNDDQQESFKKSRKKHKRIYLLPF